MTVYLRGSRNRAIRKYHTDPDCRYLDDPRETEKEQAELMGLEVCSICAGEIADRNNEGRQMSAILEDL